MKESRAIQSAFSLEEQYQQGSRLTEDTRFVLASREDKDTRENKRYLKIKNNKNNQKAQRFYLPTQTLAGQNTQQPSQQTGQPSMLNFSQINSDRAARDATFQNSEVNIHKYQSMQFKMINLSEVHFADASKSIIDSNTQESQKHNSSIDKDFITDSNFGNHSDVRLASHLGGRRVKQFKQLPEKGNFESLSNAGAAIRQPIVPGNRSALMNFRASSISRVIQQKSSDKSNNNEKYSFPQSSKQLINSNHQSRSRPVSQQFIRDTSTRESKQNQFIKLQDQKEQMNNNSNNARTNSDRNPQQTLKITFQKESIEKLRTVSSITRVRRSPMKKQEQQIIAQSIISRKPTDMMDQTQRKDEDNATNSIYFQKQSHYQSSSEQSLKKKKWISLDQREEEIQFENQREGELFFKKKATGFNLNFLGRQLTLNNKTCLENLLHKRQEIPSKYDPLAYAKFKKYLKNNRLQALMSTQQSTYPYMSTIEQQGQLQDPEELQEVKEATSQENKQHYSSSARKLNYSRRIDPSKGSSQSIDRMQDQLYYNEKQSYKAEELMTVEEEQQQSSAQKQGQKQWRYNMNVETKHITEYARTTKQDFIKNNSAFSQGDDQKILQSSQYPSNATSNPLEIDYSKSLARMGCSEPFKQQPTSQAYLFKKFVKSENTINNNNHNNNNTQIHQISGGIASDLSTNSSIGLVSPLHLKKSKFKTLEGLQSLKTENRSDLYYHRTDEDSYRSESMKQVGSDVLMQQLPIRPATQQKQYQNNDHRNTKSNYQTSNLLMILNSGSLKSQNTTEIAGCFWKINSSLLQLFTSSFAYQMILQETDLKPAQIVKRLLLFLSHSLGQGVEISGETEAAQSFVNKAKLNPKADLPFTNIGAAIEISLFSDLRLKDTSQQLLISAIKNCISTETSSDWAFKNQQKVQQFMEIVQSRMSRQLKQKNLMTELGGDPNLKRLFCSVFEHMKNKYNIDVFQKIESAEEQSSCLEQFILNLIQSGKKLTKVSQFPRGIIHNSNVPTTENNSLLFTAYEFLRLKECVQYITKRQGFSAKLTFRLLERIESIRNILQRDYQTNIGEQQIINFNAIRAAADRLDQFLVLKHTQSQSDRLVFVENMIEFVLNKIPYQSYLSYLKSKTEENLIRLFPHMIRFAQSTIFNFQKYSQIQSKSSFFSHMQHHKQQQQQQSKQHYFTLQLKYKLHLLSFMISSESNNSMNGQFGQQNKNINVPAAAKGYLGSQLGRDNEIGLIENTKVTSFDDFDEYQEVLKEQHSEMCQQGLEEIRSNGLSKSASSPFYSGIQSNEQLLKQQQNFIGDNSASGSDSFGLLCAPYFLAVSEDKEEFWEKISINLSQQLDEQEGKKSQFFNQNGTENQSQGQSIVHSKPNQSKRVSFQHTYIEGNSNVLLIKYLLDYAICAFDVFSVIDVAVIAKELKINEEKIEQSMNCLRDCMISYGLSSSQISSQLEFFKECAKYGIQNGTMI